MKKFFKKQEIVNFKMTIRGSKLKIPFHINTTLHHLSLDGLSGWGATSIALVITYNQWSALECVPFYDFKCRTSSFRGSFGPVLMDHVGEPESCKTLRPSCRDKGEGKTLKMTLNL